MLFMFMTLSLRVALLPSCIKNGFGVVELYNSWYKYYAFHLGEQQLVANIFLSLNCRIDIYIVVLIENVNGLRMKWGASVVFK